MTGSEKPLLRFDVTTSDWVLFAPARARRPHVRAKAPPPVDVTGPCPFCPGNEHLTPGEILRERGTRGTGWSVRVVPNKFQALDPAAPPEQTELGPVFREMGGYGAHEVIVESPEHSRHPADQPVEQIERVLRVLRARFTTLMADPHLRAIVVFKNHGERAGTSLVHPHWQLIATPVVPRLLRLKHAVATEYFDRTARSLYAVTLDEEAAARVRVLAANEAYLAVLPFASHVPYQVRILPRARQASFARAALADLRPLAAILKVVLGRLKGALDNPDFNLTVDTAPLGDEDEPYFVWHVDVLPRLTTPAGFELGSGMAINPVLPEAAAAVLHAVDLPEGEPR